MSNPRPTSDEIIFLVEDAPEGGLLARSADGAIFTEADDLETLREGIREAVRCHFNDGAGPRLIRLHYARDEVLTA